jgi:hypothetical protein
VQLNVITFGNPAALAAAEITVDDMITQAVRWIEVVRNYHGDGNHGELLGRYLAHAIRNGEHLTTRKAIAAAEATPGDPLADAILRETIFEMGQQHEALSPQLQQFRERCILRGPVTRGRGGDEHDDFVRNADMLLLIRLLTIVFGIKARRSGSRRPCGCSVLGQALAQHGVPIGEDRLEQLWKSPLGRIARSIDLRPHLTEWANRQHERS